MRKIFLGIKQFLKTTDWVFLVFLIFLLQASIVGKLSGLVWIYAWRFKYLKGGISSPYIKFYGLMMVYSIIELLLNFHRGSEYAIPGIIGVLYWTMGLLITLQLWVALSHSGYQKVEKALKYFFLINTLFSALQLLLVMIDSKSINPFTYIGLNYKYAASTGDYIKGVMFDLSTTNMIVNCFAVFYFLYKKNYLTALLCFAVATYTTSNIGNIILILFLIWVLLFNSNRFQKAMAVCFISILILFITQISPTNLHYLNVKISRMLHLKKPLLTTNWHDDSEKEKIADAYIKQKFNTTAIDTSNRKKIQNTLEVLKQEKIISEKKQDSVLKIIEKKSGNTFYKIYLKLYGDTSGMIFSNYYTQSPGKILAFKETLGFIKSNASTFFWGAGPGNFSSKLAHKASGLKISGSYPSAFYYIAPEFKRRHLKITLTCFVKPPEEHSLLDMPNSVFNQLLGEYGVIGLGIFVVFYLLYTLKYWFKLSYGKILIPMCLMFLMTDYWFEAFSITVVFELLMSIEVHRIKTQGA